MRKKAKIKKYHDNGDVKMKYTKVDGKLHGVREWFDENGTMPSRRENYKEGKRHGVNESYYEDGLIWVRANYVDGKLHGVREWFDENGTMYSRENFKDGVNQEL